MKHIDIISNFGNIADMIKSGDIAHNFLVKSLNDNIVHFSNSAGYVLTFDGVDYNMYQPSSGVLEADIPAASAYSFIITGPAGIITADYDVGAVAWCNGSQIETIDDHYTGVTTFTFSWSYETPLQVLFFPGQNLVLVIAEYTSTPEEDCGCAGGTWDPETEECEMPEPDPEPEPDPDDCQGDPECECAQQGADWYWDGEMCQPVTPPDEESPAE